MLGIVGLFILLCVPLVPLTALKLPSHFCLLEYENGLTWHFCSVETILVFTQEISIITFNLRIVMCLPYSIVMQAFAVCCILFFQC
jgi:hypothetical protein